MFQNVPNYVGSLTMPKIVKVDEWVEWLICMDGECVAVASEEIAKSNEAYARRNGYTGEITITSRIYEQMGEILP